MKRGTEFLFEMELIFCLFFDVKSVHAPDISVLFTKMEENYRLFLMCDMFN